MHKLTVTYDPDTQFCPLEFKYNRRFQDLLRLGIKPPSYRRYDRENKRWSVHVSRLPYVISFAKRYFTYVDYSALPEAIQIEIVQYLENSSHTEISYTEITRNSYEVLHLLPSAPKEVVKAAYRALVQKHHPDHGGEAEAFRQIQEAYEALKKQL